MFPARSSPWLLPGTKSVGYATHIAAENEARRGGRRRRPRRSRRNRAGGPVTNVWWREDELLVTPGFELGILAGETRAALLELADELTVTSRDAFARAAPRGGRGLHLVVRPRGDAVIAVDDRRYLRREAADALLEALRRAALG